MSSGNTYSLWLKTRSVGWNEKVRCLVTMHATMQRARAAVRELDQGDGVIVLTDMFGSTPSNIATALKRDNEHVTVIAGVNLPMLVRLMNYPRLGMVQLKDKALSGGREGIFSCGPEGEV